VVVGALTQPHNSSADSTQPVDRIGIKILRALPMRVTDTKQKRDSG
jgi:hypothetical protein